MINFEEILKLKGKTKADLARFLEIQPSNVNRIIHNENISLSKIENICSFLDISLIDAMMISGYNKGEMLKCNIAGRDNVGTGNEIAGDNTGVIGNTGTVGDVGGNHVSIPSNNIKKIMNEDGVGIEFTQSTDSLQQRNVYLEARIKDLEILNASQAKTIETMQLLIDMLTKK